MSPPIEVDDQESPFGHDGHESVLEGSSKPFHDPDPRSGSEESISRGSTRSISGSVVEHHISENGRRYCGEIYYMPNDDDEQTRLVISHQAYLPVLDGQLTLGLIPRNARKILDIGTGSGDWAIAVAERFKKAEVTATDITTAFQPASAPSNLFFELDDAQDEWTFTDPFDFIHMRDLAGAFCNWDAVYAEASKHLKGGGTFEIAERGMLQLTKEPPHSYVSIFSAAIQSASEKAGTPINLDHLKKPVLEKAGLHVMKSKKFDIPLGNWSLDPHKKIAGKMAMISALEGLEAMSLRLLTKYMDWKPEDVRDLCEKVKEEVLQPDARAYLPVYFVVARKLMV